jgi:hypothetical protein
MGNGNIKKIQRSHVNALVIEQVNFVEDYDEEK